MFRLPFPSPHSFSRKNLFLYHRHSSDTKSPNLQDGDQTKYVPPTPFQSAVSTAKYSWKNLSLETIQDGLDAIGGAAANHLTTAVTGLTQQVPAESSISAPRAQKSFKQDFKNWEPETNFFTKEEQEDALNLHRTKDLKTDKKLRRKMNEKRQNSAFQHGKPHYGQAPSHRDSLGVENQEELGPIFEQEKQFNPTGLSAQWQRQVRGEGSNDRKQRIRTEWHDKEDRGTRQEKIYAGSHAGEGSSIPPKHTHLTRRNKDRDNRKRMDEPARDAVHEKRKDGNSAATIEKVTIPFLGIEV